MREPIRLVWREIGGSTVCIHIDLLILLYDRRFIKFMDYFHKRGVHRKAPINFDAVLIT